MKRCSIGFETLADYRDGRVDATSIARVREHIESGCAHCREGLAWLDRAAGDLRDAHRHPVPDRLLHRLHGIFADRFRLPERRALLARLTFDGRGALAAAGARSLGGTAFKMNYSVEDFDVEIWEEPVDQGRWYVIGQILPAEGDEVISPQEVVLTDAAGASTSVRPELSEVHLPAISPGNYRMVFKMPEIEVVIEDFVVGRDH